MHALLTVDRVSVHVNSGDQMDTVAIPYLD